MPRRNFKTPFAVSGDQAVVPTEIQPDGSVSIIQGYGPDYQRPTDGSDPQAKVIDRASFNGLMNDITSSIGEMQQYGLPIWSAGMAPYPANAQVRHKGENWVNSVDNNSAEPGTSGSNWLAPQSGGAQKFTQSGTFTVPPGVTKVYISAAAGGGGGGGGGGRSSVARESGGAGGGAAGRSTIKEAVSVTGGQQISVTIGSGGAGGSSGQIRGNGGNGGSGGTTSFGSLLSLSGGAGGGGGSASGSGGSGASPGGQWGGDGTANDKAGDGGSGGSGPFGTGGGGGRAGGSGGTVASGSIAFGYGVGGAGGGGAYGSASFGAQGGAGMPGVLIVEW